MGFSSECKALYLQLHSSCGNIVNESFDADTENRQSANHHFIRDFETWLEELQDRPEHALLQAALLEYQDALLAVVQGQYRQAFMGLRFFLELGLGAILFSSDELGLRLWFRGERDIVWSKIVNNDTGVFSKCFMRAFNEALVDDAPEYQAIAELLYRECSEYVHGNFATLTFLPKTAVFDRNVYLDWHDKAKSARLVIVFALCARYLEQMDQGSLQNLESAILDELGYVTAIRAHFGGNTEV